jgi:hypothetical protein
MPISFQYVQLFSNEMEVKSEVVCIHAMKIMRIGTVDIFILEIGSLWRCGVCFTPLPP